jgi:hypothetical protein
MSLGAEGGVELTTSSFWAPAFCGANWQPTFSDDNERFMQGWLRDEGNFDSSDGRDAALQQDFNGDAEDAAVVRGFRTKDDSFHQIGA